MAFVFRLETVLNVRRSREEQVQQKLGHELFVLENHRQYLEELKQKRAETAEQFDQRKKQNMVASLFSFFVEALRHLERDVEFQKNAIQAQEQTVQKVREELTEKVKERKIVERLREKDHLEYLKEVQRKEQNDMDEMAVLRHGQETL